MGRQGVQIEYISGKVISHEAIWLRFRRAVIDIERKHVSVLSVKNVPILPFRRLPMNARVLAVRIGGSVSVWVVPQKLAIEVGSLIEASREPRDKSEPRFRM